MKLGQEKKFKMKSGKEATLIVLNLNPLVIGWKSKYAPRCNWDKQKETIKDWYDKEFPEELKDMFKLEDLHPLNVENLVTELPPFVKPIKASYSFKLDYFPDVPWDEKCKERQYYNWYWLENNSSISRYGCNVDGDDGNFDYNSWNYDYVVFPAFHVNL